MNKFEIQVFQLTNQIRQRYGLRPLVVNSQLTGAARFHSQDMARINYISHISSNGLQFTDRARKFGYRFSFIGENVAAGQRTPQEVVNGWMNSSGHRRNLLNPNYSEIGVGYVYSGYGYQSYITQVLASK